MSHLPESFFCFSLFVSVVTCSTNGYPVELSTRGGTFANIFWDVTFPCAGIVREIHFFAYVPGLFFLDIWRKSGEKYRLEYIVPINATVNGTQASVYFI